MPRRKKPVVVTETPRDVQAAFNERAAEERKLSEELRSKLTPLGQRVIDAIGDLIYEKKQNWGEAFWTNLVTGEEIARRLRCSPQRVGGALTRLVELEYISTEYERAGVGVLNDGICQTPESWRAHSKWAERWWWVLMCESSQDWWWAEDLDLQEYAAKLDEVDDPA